MRTTEGELRTVDVTLESFSSPDRVAFFVIPAVLSLVFLGLSLWIFGLRRTESAGRAFSMMTTSVAIVIGALYDLYSFHYFTYAWTLAAAMSGGAVIDLALCFPQEARLLLRRPYLRWFGYAIGAALAVSAFSNLYDLQNPTAYFVSWRNIYIFVGWFVWYLGLLYAFSGGWVLKIIHWGSPPWGLGGFFARRLNHPFWVTAGVGGPRRPRWVYVWPPWCLGRCRWS